MVEDIKKSKFKELSYLKFWRFNKTQLIDCIINKDKMYKFKLEEQSEQYLSIINELHIKIRNQNRKLLFYDGRNDNALKKYLKRLEARVEARIIERYENKIQNETEQNNI